MLRGCWILFLILILFTVWADNLSALGQRLSSGSDLAGLFSLRASLGLRARDWPRNADPCAAWAGVGCRGGRVVSLNVSGLRRTRLGRLNPRFAVDGFRSLSRLAVFNASGFPLPGPIPDWFGSRLPLSFSVLVLRRSAVNGSIPYSLGGVASLSVLDLAGNSITGNIPPTLGQLGNLSRLDLSGNELTGSIPASFGALPNLTYLNLSNNFLTGPVPLALGTLPKLNTLVLTNNNLDGSLPPQLGDLASLVKLDLGLNSLSGTLPDDLKNLRRLQVLDLSRNSFSGPLSRTLFSSLSSLRSVALSHNNFSGALPEMLWSLSGLQFLDVSSNNLTGTIPDLATAGANASDSVFNISSNLYYGSIPSGFGILLARFSAVDLSGNYLDGLVPVNNGKGNVSLGSNCFRNASNQRSLVDCQKFYTERGLLYDGPVPPTGLPPPSSSHKKSSWSWKYILIAVLAGIAFLGVFILVIVLCLMRRGARATEQRESTANVVPSGAGVPASAVSVNLSAVGDSFTYDQLLQATSDFNDSNLIKHGHSGDLYRGVLEDAIPVVVKRIDIRIVKREAYVVELDLFAKASHARLVPFVGHCLENENEKLLVYKYMPHGDLSNALYKKPGQDEEGLQSLDWITRLKIATGVAEALCFLHHECTPPLVHRDVQASSILLDDKFEVRLGSLSEVCTQEGDSHQNVVTRFLRLSSQSSDRSATGSPSATCAYDVYCLGKVLLELVTGKLGISGSNDASTNQWLEHILPYISIYEKDMVTKIVDPSLIVDEDLLEEVWAMAIVAKSCLNPKPSKRPLVRYILKALENPLKVVREENNSSSSARLRATSSRGSWNAALFRSWRYSSSDNIAPTTGGPPREDRVLKRSGTMRSQGSGGEHSTSHRKPSKEIFPEPSGLRDIED